MERQELWAGRASCALHRASAWMQIYFQMNPPLSGPANPFRKAGAAGPNAVLRWLPVEQQPQLAHVVKMDFELFVSRAQFTLGVYVCVCVCFLLLWGRFPAES